MDEKGNPKSIKLPETVEAFSNLKNAKRFAIDIGGTLTKIAYYSTVSYRRINYEADQDNSVSSEV
jgi:pantothenate kinase